MTLWRVGQSFRRHLTAGCLGLKWHNWARQQKNSGQSHPHVAASVGPASSSSSSSSSSTGPVLTDLRSSTQPGWSSATDWLAVRAAVDKFAAGTDQRTDRPPGQTGITSGTPTDTIGHAAVVNVLGAQQRRHWIERFALRHSSYL